MNINTICPQCGGYISPYVTWTAGNLAASVKLCTSSTNYNSPRVEPICVPIEVDTVTRIGTSIVPNEHETLWEIVQEVAEGNSLHTLAGRYYCNYCEGSDNSVNLVLLAGYFENPDDAREKFIRQFPHQLSCIVTKARGLVERRKAQPRMEITFTQASDGTAMTNALIHWQKLIDKDGEVPRD